MRTEAQPRYRITIAEGPDVTIASVTAEVDLETVGAHVQAAFGTLGRTIGEAGAFGDGPPGLIVHEMDRGSMTVEVFMPIARSFTPSPGVEIRTLPGGRVATTLHQGPYDGLGAAYQSVTAWIADHRLVSTGPPRERYLNDPHVAGTVPRTRIEFPVA